MLAFQSLHAFAATLAHPNHSPLVGFASLAPPTPAVAAALTQPLNAEVAAAYPELMAAATAVMEQVILHHPSLLEAIMFPTALEEAEKAPAAGGAAPALPPADKDKEAKKKQRPQKEACSALDGMWSALQDARVLFTEQPRLIAAVLRLLFCMYEAPAHAGRPLELLRCRPGFWACIAACLPSEEVVAAVDGGLEVRVGGWGLGMEVRCWGGRAAADNTFFRNLKNNFRGDGMQWRLRTAGCGFGRRAAVLAMVMASLAACMGYGLAVQGGVVTCSAYGSETIQSQFP